MTVRPSYGYSHTVGFNASMGGRGFSYPVDAALGDDDTLFVINRAAAEDDVGMNSKGVTVCTVTEGFLGRFSAGGTGDGDMMWPVAIALDGDRNIYISDEYLHRISIFNKRWEFVDKWGTRGSGPGEFQGPAGIAFDGEGNLLVVDAQNCRIQRYTRDGAYLGGWGRPGAGQGELNMPWGIAVDGSGCVYVADWRNDRIQKFDTDGEHLSTFGSPGSADGQLNRPSGVAVDAEGYIHVADWGNERVQVLQPDGSYLAKLRGDSIVSKWGMEYFNATPEELQARKQADMEVAEWTPRSPSEESATREKLFWGPVSVKVDQRGRLFVVESCRYRIQVYERAP